MPRPLCSLAALLLSALAASAAGQQGDAPGKPPAKGQAKAPPAKVAPAAQHAAETFPFDESQPALGQWVGMLQLGPDTRGFCALRITAGPDGQPAAQLLHPYGTSPCQDVAVEDRKLSLRANFAPRELSLAVTVSADGQTLTGEETVAGPGQPDATSPVSLRRVPRAAELAGARAWSGTLSLPGKGDVPFALVLGSTPGGRLVGEVDIPALNLAEGLLLDVKRTDKQLSATWPAKTPVVLALTFGEEDRTLEGEARLPGAANAVKLALDDALLAKRVAALQPPPPAGDPK